MTNLPVEGVESVAVIGMAGRFPKARNYTEFWRNLKEGVECISFFGEDLGPAQGGADHSHHVGAEGILEDVDLFDAPFFGMSARDAEATDPQQRLFLECAWESMEDAGYVPDHYPGLVGVFGGAGLSGYLEQIYSDPNVYDRYQEMQIFIGNDKDHLTTQVSYKLNLRGPSVAVQTACSTSLVAVCMACQSLLNYECDLALAGGVAAEIESEEGYFYQPGGILSPDGHCRPFDADANGIVGGNGVGIVVLKRLSEALRDRDHVRALIRGFALNNDGSRKVGYTAPSVGGQAEVISMAHALAGVDPESITYVEAHGTGTALGDPIEVAALQEVFGSSSTQKAFCALGSVKSNIGHLDTAAGIAGLMKTVLSIEHRLLPPSLNFSKPNPAIPFSETAFFVNTELTPWKSPAGPLRAAVSSFGIGGTNAHVVLEEPPDPTQWSSADGGRTRPYTLLTLSARSQASLEQATEDLANHLDSEKPEHLADIAFTLRVGRTAFAHRRALTWATDDVSGAVTALRQRDAQPLLTGRAGAKALPVHFMFPGQGAQHAGMGADLYENEQRFREEIDLCSEVLRPRLGVDLRELLFPITGDHDRSETMLRQTQFTQPALFSVEYALARVWMDWGIHPTGMIGHSIGEYVAACLAGVLPVEDALELVALRGQLMGSMPAGGMLAVPLPEDSLEAYCRRGLSIAAVNSPQSAVLSGRDDVLNEVEEELRRHGVNSVRLSVSHAFHSEMMDSAARQLVERVRSLRLCTPKLPYISNVTGTWAMPDQVTDPEYWGQHLRNTVRFADGLASLHDGSSCALLEVGPGVTLAGLARQQTDQFSEQLVISSLGPAGSADSGLRTLLRSLGRLWVTGVEADGMAYYRHEHRSRAPLPTYPFERQRYWLAPSEQTLEAYPEVDSGYAKSMTGDDVDDWFYYPSWQPSLSPPPTILAPSSKEQGWLVFDDGGSIAAGLLAELRTHGRVVTVSRAGHFAQLADGGYAIDATQASHYDRLLEALEAEGGCPRQAIHLWNLTGHGAEDEDPGELGASGFFSVNHLAQAALRARLLREGFTVSVVTNRVHSVTGRELLSPAKASILGACRVLPQELPRLTARVIDIDDDCFEPSRVPAATEALVAEILSDSTEPVVALRRGYRWVQTFEAAWLADDSDRESRLREGGTYLITGGLGSIGRVIASYLTQRWCANLVLTGRTPLPEPESWSELLDAEPADPVTAKVEALLELQSGGAEVLYLACDVADLDAVDAVVAAAEQRFGRIDGVIHGAGLTEGLVAESEVTPQTAEAQLRPKVGGLAALGSALEGRQIDFLLTLSSLSAVLGGLGLLEYAAANCVMDAMCAEHNREGGAPWISVDWDAWDFSSDDWNGTDEEAEAVGILPSQGEAAFQRIVDRAPSHVVVSVGDLYARIDDWVRLSPQETSPSPPDVEAELHERPDLLTEFVPARTSTETHLVDIWQNLLGIAPVGTADNFFELGGHSLMAIQVVSRISEQFEIDLTVAKVFEAPTIAGLAELIDAGSESTSLTSESVAELLEIVEQLSVDELEVLQGTGTFADEGGVPDD